jgi:hypothetical protein
VHAPLGDNFAVEMGKLFEEPDVLQQLRPSWAGGQHVLVVDDWAASIGSQSLLFTHGVSPSRLEWQCVFTVTLTLDP